MHLSVNFLPQKIRKTYRALSEARKNILHEHNPNKYKYKLLQKIDNLDVKSTPFDTLAPLNTETVSVVTVGERGTDKFYKSVITFYDKKKNILQRNIEGNGTNIRRHYETRGDDVARLRNIVTEKYDDSICQYKTSQIEKQVTYKLPHKRKFSTKLTIFKNVNDGDVIHSTVTEYPFNGHGALRYLRKSLGLDLEMRKGIPYIISTFETANAKFPSGDRFLPFRFMLDQKQKLHSMTRFFLKEKGLEKMNTRVYSSDKVGKYTAGFFDETTNEIVYNPETCAHVADLSAHEVEHAYQYSQIGRIGKGYSKYERTAQKLYGQIPNSSESLEAHRYAIASQNYPKIGKDDNPAEIPGYKENYLEIKANEAGEKAKKEYDEGAKFLKDQFHMMDF